MNDRQKEEEGATNGHSFEERLHRNYCDIVIQSHPCQLVQPFVSQLARTS